MNNRQIPESNRSQAPVIGADNAGENLNWHAFIEQSPWRRRTDTILEKNPTKSMTPA